jgi:CDP-paratose 2-epimerase
MSVVVVTGSGGLIGGQAAEYFGRLGLTVVGVDNDMRRAFFGEDASTAWNTRRIETALGAGYIHNDLDIRDRSGVSRLFRRYGRSIELVIHAAAQPSHDWAARDPFTDFDINAVGSINLLEATRRFCPDACFVFTSTNKVYGDHPNQLPFVELETRFEIDPSHRYYNGIREDMPVDGTLHSLFGASKVAADVLVQEYGRYYGMNTVCFRGGTLTGPAHSATELHGFLAYVMRCAMTGTPYRVFGYKGKQVRDAIHANDLVRAFHEYYKSPRPGAVYNIGGGRFSNCSVLEAIALCEEISGHPVEWSYVGENRVGDHIWWIGDNSSFQDDYPEWQLEFGIERILKEINVANQGRWAK